VFSGLARRISIIAPYFEEKKKRAVSGAPVVRSPSFVYRKATKPGTNRTGASVGGRRRVMLVMLTSEQ
jgi:hypothetical protein